MQIKKIEGPKHGESNPGNPGKSADPVKSDVSNHPESSPIKVNPGEIREDADPVKSDVQRNTRITRIKTHMLGDDIREIIDGLLKDDYHINPNETGFSIGNKAYKLAITKPADASKLEALQTKMKALGFEQVNQGTYGPLFFTRSVKKEEKQ